MAFTLAHPALIIPFKYVPKKWRSFTGLIIGSMAPDFESFIKFDIEKSFSHSFPGMFIIDLPLSIAMVFVFHNFIKQPLLNNLPLYFKKRFFQYKDFNWNAYFKKNWPVVIISILIGILSHFLWDSCTHDKGTIVKMVPWLQKDVIILGIDTTVHMALQYISSIIGLLILAYAIHKLPQLDSRLLPGTGNKKTMCTYWGIAIVTMIVVFCIRAYKGFHPNQNDNAVIALISGSFIGIVVATLFSDPVTVTNS